ncbi:hypothetical protein [Microlunatus sp. GCM10028923]|uniref:hypothetical protein n=1 Tax=Microlunatus sp. GCM10028923 TaxID=3273400 RepID=UPI00361EADD7
MSDPDLDRLAELSACLAGDSAVEVLARVLPRPAGEELPETRDRLVRAALDLPRTPVIVPADHEQVSITEWLRRLPVADRALITLRYGERLAPAELARSLGQPVTRIERRLAALAAEVPQPAEAYLSYGLDRLAEQAPGPGLVGQAVRARLQARTQRHRRLAALIAVVVLLMIMIPNGAGLLRWYTFEAAAVVDGVQLRHRVDPPDGWRILAVGLSRTLESTTLFGEANLCHVLIGEVAVRGRNLREVTVRGERGMLTDSDLGWFSQAGSVVVRCGRPTPRDTLIGLANAVRFQVGEFRTPIGLSRLPAGFNAAALDRAENGSTHHQLTVDRYEFRVGLSVPPDSRNVRTCGSLSPPPRLDPNESEERRVTRTETQFLRTPDGIVCATLHWHLADPDRGDRDRAQQLLARLARQVTLAPDPADPATWLDAETALPSP